MARRSNSLPRTCSERLDSIERLNLLEHVVDVRPVGDQIIDGNVHVVFPGASNGGEIKHLGQEIGFVIEGQIELTVGRQEFRLNPGDSFFFRSSLPHSYRNTTSQISKVVWINTPPTF